MPRLHRRADRRPGRPAPGSRRQSTCSSTSPPPPAGSKACRLALACPGDGASFHAAVANCGGALTANDSRRGLYGRGRARDPGRQVTYGRTGPHHREAGPSGTGWRLLLASPGQLLILCETGSRQAGYDGLTTEYATSKYIQQEPCRRESRQAGTRRGCPVRFLDRGGAASSAIRQAGMLVLYVLAGYAALGTWIAWLVSRRRKDNEVIAALRRQFAHVDAKREAAERAAAVAEEQCLQALQ